MKKEDISERDDLFICEGCGREVGTEELIGTKNRNHCPYCLTSKHLDELVSGDRASHCKGKMIPVALTFKKEGFDKYGKERRGELMIVHRCEKCNKFSINRLSGDDDEGAILKLFGEAATNETLREELKGYGITALEEKNKEEVYLQLFGKGIDPFQKYGRE